MVFKREALMLVEEVRRRRTRKRWTKKKTKM